MATLPDWATDDPIQLAPVNRSARGWADDDDDQVEPVSAPEPKPGKDMGIVTRTATGIAITRPGFEWLEDWRSRSCVPVKPIPLPPRTAEKETTPQGKKRRKGLFA